MGIYRCFLILVLDSNSVATYDNLPYLNMMLLTNSKHLLPNQHSLDVRFAMDVPNMDWNIIYDSLLQNH